jgi:hypothetical protein
MDERDIAVATMTLARAAGEERLLRASLPLLSESGAPVFVTNGGSGEAFADFLGTLVNFNLCEPARGLWPQVTRSLRAAYHSGRRFVLYTEPDKRDFFREHLREFVSEASGGEGVGVTLASRSEDAFSTFPEFQRHTESAINRCCAEVVGRRFDFTYGPCLLSRDLIPHLLNAPDVGWGWRPYAFGLARRLGYRVECVVRDLRCPPEQREDDARERLYRMRQLGQSVEGLLLATAAEESEAVTTRRE